MSKYPSLDFAQAVTDRANAAWDDGSFIESVTPTTRALLTYWFDPAFADLRNLNFHAGQRQAILNAIYIHEVLKKERVLDVYEAIAPQLLLERGSGLEHLGDAIYNHPKYAVKMATGTGKTWVLQAMLIWQYLNARHEEGNYTKNFLVVAPGLIVYERLLDAFQGKLREDGVTRDFETSDLYGTKELFIPEEYRDEVFGFLQSSVAAKTDIGSKVTGDGLIAITNYHLLMGVEEEEKEAKLATPEIDSWKLPVSPGVAAGNSLDVLDAGLGRRKELEYLRSLPDLMVVNDEAHHIHTIKRGGEVSEVEWQKSLRYIAEGKDEKFIQVDFSATPYNERGKEKIYFPHIIVDFELKTAIRKGLVKTLVLDERKELATEELDYKAIRDGSGHVIDLSEGQRQMLRAGMSKLNLLEQSFDGVAGEGKSPKLMVMCEDTDVVPHVAKFLQDEGLGEDEILEIHSNKKGEVGEEEWRELKRKLFALDKTSKPRVVISVLMLREGFDVNNICVIVPLRSSQSGILLEQTIGRGLRLMWRGDAEIDELKRENRQRIMVEHKSASNYFDVLSIVEHPAFRDFYKDLINDGLVGVEDEPPIDEPGVKGDLLTVGLRENYEQYDFRLPLIVSESSETMQAPSMDVTQLKPFHIAFESMKKIVPKSDQWRSIEVTSEVKFGDYEVTSGVFRATSYNDFVARLVNRISDKLFMSTADAKSTHKLSKAKFPAMSINTAHLAQITDEYIRTRLFNQIIDPTIEDNWRVLKVDTIVDHVVGQIAGLVAGAQEETEVHDDTEVMFIPLSGIDRLTVRENYAIELAKNIYEMTPYPSNKGQYERDFMEYADRDGAVDAVAKIIENRHTFVRFRYVRDDGLPAQYIPDFFVRFGNDVFIVETKAQDQVSHSNVVRKQKAAVRWCERINKLPSNKREGLTWHYTILGHATFYDWKNKMMGVRDMLDFAELRNDEAAYTGRLL